MKEGIKEIQDLVEGRIENILRDIHDIKNLNPDMSIAWHNGVLYAY